jgi:hypothetical protein
MLDAEFFDTTAVAQLDEMGAGSTSFEVRLFSGLVYRVRRILSASAGYVILEVYPDEGVSKKSKKKRMRDDKSDVVWDRVAIPYDNIQLAFMTVADDANENGIGFIRTRST